MAGDGLRSGTGESASLPMRVKEVLAMFGEEACGKTAVFLHEPSTLLPPSKPAACGSLYSCSKTTSEKSALP